jgi:hypothetical protein
VATGRPFGMRRWLRGTIETDRENKGNRTQISWRAGSPARGLSGGRSKLLSFGFPSFVCPLSSGAGHLPRFRLSDRQSARLRKRDDPGGDRGSLRQRLRARTGACRGDCRNHHRGNDRIRRRGQGRRLRPRQAPGRRPASRATRSLIRSRDQTNVRSGPCYCAR